MNTADAHCSVCRSPLPAGVREEFCPVCSLRGALELEPDEPALPESVRYVGDYELVEQVARGGMGVVYRARQRSLGRDVAVKMILAGQFASPEARARFRAEASAAAKLQHPNIVAIHEIGEHEGQPYFSMDYVEGRTLAEALRDGPLPARRAAIYLRAIAAAIHFAHWRGTLHRDLKPSNVLLDLFDEPRVTDFGLARQLGDESELTQTGQLLGSPGYASPEQARGERATITAASDVYSLGAILYHTLTGRPPFQGESIGAILHQVEHEEPVPPRRLNASIPADLETIALKCLEKEPERRYGSAQALADDLDRFLKGEPVSARPIGAMGRAWRWSQRHRALATSMALVAILIPVTVVVSVVAAIRVSVAEQRATVHLRDTLLAQARAVRLTGEDGRKAASLAVLQQAIEMGLPAEQRLPARNEWTAAQALADMAFIAQPQLPPPAGAALAAIDPSFEHYARMAAPGWISVHAVSDGRELKRFSLGNAGDPVQLAFSPGGGYLLLARGLKTTTVEVWDWRQARRAHAQVSTRDGLKVFPDDGGFLAGTREGEVAVHELPSGRETSRWPLKVPAGFEDANGNVTLGLSRDGALLAVALRRPTDNPLDFYGARSGDWRSGFKLDAAVNTIFWGQQESWMALGTQADGVSAFKLPDRGYVFGFNTAAPVDSVVAEPDDGSILVASCRDRFVRVFSQLSGRALFTIPGDARQLVFSADGRRVGPVFRDRVVGWLEYSPPTYFEERLNTATDITQERVSVEPTGNLFVTTAADGVRLNGFDPHGAMVLKRTSDAAFDAADGGLLMAGAQGVTRATIAATNPRRTLLNQVQLLPAGGNWTHIATAQSNLAYAAGSQTQGALVAAIRMDAGTSFTVGSHPGLTHLTASPDGRWLASAGRDRRLRVWDIGQRKPSLELTFSIEAKACFSPDGGWLVVTGEKFHLWKRAVDRWQPQPPPPLLGNQGLVDGGGFSPDGKLLAVVVDFHSVQLLEFPSLRPLTTLEPPHRVRLRALAWSADGRRLLAAGHQGKVHLWEIARLREGLSGVGLNW